MEHLDKATIDALNTALDEGELGPLRAALARTDLAVCGEDALDWVLVNAPMTDHAGPILDALCEAGLNLAELVPANDGTDARCPRVDRLLLGIFLATGTNLDVAVLDALLAAKPDVNAAGADGATPLMRAASREGAGRTEAIERLLGHGADPGRRDGSGRTAADYAAAVPAPEYLALLGPSAQTTPAPHCAAHDLRPGGWFVLEPWRDGRAWRWVAPAASAAAAQQHIESEFGTSRPPIGPFAALEVVDTGDATRGADAHASPAPGQMAPGQLVVLTLSALVPVPANAGPTKALPRAMFVVRGVFEASPAAAARACAEGQRGWSVIARLGALTLMSDGWPEAVTSSATG